MLHGLLSTGLVLIGTSLGGHGGSSGPPTQQMIRVQSNGQLQVFYQVMMCVPETVTKTVQQKMPVNRDVTEDVNGEVRKKIVTEYQTVEKSVQCTIMKTVCSMKERVVKTDKVKAFDTDGRAISAKQLAQRASGDTLVVVSGNDEMIPDYYAGLFKLGTIILAFEQEAAGQRAPPAAPAAPAPAAPVEAQSRPNAALPSVLIRTVSQPKEGDDAVELRVPESAPAPIFPQTMPPIFVFASREGAQSFKLRQLMENSLEITSYKVKGQRTGKQMIPVQMTQTIRHNEITTIAGKDLQFFTGDGAAMASDRVKEKLSREGTVLYAADGEAVDSFWLQNFKPTTLVIVGPQLRGGCGGPMGYSVPCAPAMPAPVRVPAVEPVPPPQAAPVPVESKASKT